MSLTNALQFEETCYAKTIHTEDRLEGLEALLHCGGVSPSDILNLDFRGNWGGGGRRWRGCLLLLICLLSLLLSLLLCVLGGLEFAELGQLLFLLHGLLFIVNVLREELLPSLSLGGGLGFAGGLGLGCFKFSRLFVSRRLGFTGCGVVRGLVNCCGLFGLGFGEVLCI